MKESIRDENGYVHKTDTNKRTMEKVFNTFNTSCQGVHFKKKVGTETTSRR